MFSQRFRLTWFVRTNIHYFLRHIIKIKIYAFFRFKVAIFICEFLVFILYFF